ncbi:MAG: Gfo/Idh/MocA family oxidoreductase [Kiritimatiellae bacterium]|nr:Gfo/Idh/MocA family oxidoreductase [Kiritimatiellia bacterium]
MNSRRDFIKSTLLAGAACSVTGGLRAETQAARTGTDAAPMLGFACKPMETVRVGVVGIGSRGMGMVNRVSKLPGVVVAAVCDIQDAKINAAKNSLARQKRPEPKVYKGPEAYKALCDSDVVDVIYNSTPWHLHVPVALAAMEGGKHVLTEVTAAFTVEDCWKMVETAEQRKVHCMQLENCIYGEFEMFTFNLVREGILGEVMHAEGAYNHDGRHMANDLFPAYQYWRYDWYRDHAGNPYPTHGLVPLCLTMDVNRGDRMDYIVSLDSKNASFAYFMEHGLKKDNPRKGQTLKVGDVNTSLIRTVNGKSIMLQHTVSTPRPYSRIQTMQGTRGIVSQWPWTVRGNSRVEDWRIAISGLGKGTNEWLGEKAVEELRQKYKHPLWKTIGELAKKMGGHGGMDYIQDARWSYCLRMGLPLDTSVYDLATTGCLCELTEKSVANRSQAMDVPDFTRGAWKTAPKMGVIDIDLAHFEV